MQKEQRQILQLIEGKIGDNEQFAYECRIKEIEWDMAKELKNYRCSLHISQEEVAQKSGLTRQMVSRVETFSYSPNLTTLIKYLYALDIDLAVVIHNLSFFQNN